MGRNYITVVIVFLLLFNCFNNIPIGSVEGLRHGNDTSISNADASFFGWGIARSISISGDVNGDGYDDILIGAWQNQTHLSGSGETFLIFGKELGWTMDFNISYADASFYGYESDERSGGSVDIVGDVNGDGYDDILIGAPFDFNNDNKGKAYLIFGKSDGWNMGTNLSESDVTFFGPKETDNTGFSVSGIGDVNGDGYKDIAIGALRGGSWDQGRVYLILGKKSGWEETTNLSSPYFSGESSADKAGSTVTGLGDVDGDNLDDFLIGARGFDNGHGFGKYYLILGDENINGGDLANADASWKGEEDEIFLRSTNPGYVGDINGDGMNDIGISVGVSLSTEINHSETFLFFGRENGWKNFDLTEANASFDQEADSYVGYPISGTGDINGDGLDDFMLSGKDPNCSECGITYIYLGRTDDWSMNMSMNDSDASYIGLWGDWLGSPMAGRGDINGDGYNDIVLDGKSGPGGIEQRRAYLIFPDLNSRPSSIVSVKVFLDEECSKEISYAGMGQTIYIELVGIDGNISRADIALVNVTSNVSSPLGFRLLLKETGLNTGKYRGNFTVMERFHEEYRWLNSAPTEVINITSILDPTKKASLLIGEFKLMPANETWIIYEDKNFVEHFWAENGSVSEWSFSTNASWLSWSSVTQNISGFPDNSDVGYYWVNITVTDIYNYIDWSNFTIYVNNIPPIITTENIETVIQDEDYFIDYNCTDENQGTTSWSLNTNASWLNIVSFNGVLSGKPTNDDVGFNWVNVSVDDGNNGTDSTNFTLSVIDINDPPFIITEDDTVAYEDEVYYVDYNATDVDINDVALTWSIITDASWLEFDLDTGELHGLPKNNDVGQFHVNITVTDAQGGIDFHDFPLLVINTNDPPEWIDIPENITILDNESYFFDVNASDIDFNELLQYYITSDPSTQIKINRSSGIINWTPEAAGTYNINLSVTDFTVTLFHEFTITVKKSNNPPAATLMTPLNEYQLDVQNPTLTWSTSDEDGDNVTSDLYLSEILASVEALEVTNKRGDALTTTYFTPSIPLEKGKTYFWTVIPYDGFVFGECTNKVWSFNISETAKINHPPEFVTEPSLEAGVNVEWIYEPLALDEDENDTVIIGIVLGPGGMAFTTGVLRWTPNKNQIGVHNVKIEATDSETSVYQEFVIKVSSEGPSNHMPTISTIEPKTIMEGDKLSIQILGADEDGDTLSYSIVKGPEDVQISDSGLLTWKTKKGDEGVYNIIVKVSDGKLSTTRTISVTVKKADKPKPQEEDISAFIPPFLLIIIILVILVVVLIMWRRKKGGASETVAEPTQPPPEVQLPQGPQG